MTQKRAAYDHGHAAFEQRQACGRRRWFERRCRFQRYLLATCLAISSAAVVASRRGQLTALQHGPDARKKPFAA